MSKTVVQVSVLDALNTPSTQVWDEVRGVWNGVSFLKKWNLSYKNMNSQNMADAEGQLSNIRTNPLCLASPPTLKSYIFNFPLPIQLRKALCKVHGKKKKSFCFLHTKWQASTASSPSSFFMLGRGPWCLKWCSHFVTMSKSPRVLRLTKQNESA